MKRYFKLWWFFTKNTTNLALQSRFGSVFFMIGKFIRFFMLFYFLYILLSETKTLAGFNLYEIIFFYATFNIIDVIPQLLLRETYRFRYYVIQGFLDYILTKPMSPLFRSLFGGSDVLDIPMLLLSVGFLVYAGMNIGPITFIGVLLYLILVFNAVIIAFSVHIFILGFGIMTADIDNSVMLYRDITRMGQIPVDVYKAPVSFIITFILPVGIMMSFPVKALLGLLSWPMVLIAFIFAGVFLLSSLWFWQFSLKQYQSASS
jgi:ABC-2 type transport system permease protein